MTSLSCKVKYITRKYFKLIWKRHNWNLWKSKGHGARWLIRDFLDKIWKRRGIKIVKKGAQNWFTWSSHRKWQTTHIPQVCGAAWSSRWLTVQLTLGQHTCELVFKPKADILNICHDCQFVSSVLYEFHVSHHAWCSRYCSKGALSKYEMWRFIFTR